MSTVCTHSVHFGCISVPHRHAARAALGPASSLPVQIVGCVISVRAWCTKYSQIKISMFYVFIKLQFGTAVMAALFTVCKKSAKKKKVFFRMNRKR